MTDVTTHAAGSIEALVAALPEKYQPIFGHPDLSDGSSRGCEDRLQLILATAQRLSDTLGRPLRVLDLGCAQGFFSLSLAAAGHSVHGADFLDKNVDVCTALAAEQGLGRATFQCGRIEDIAATLQVDTFDLVLGLSVFHHLVHEHGLPAVTEIVSGLAQKISCGIYEVALREEPLYWGPSQPAHAAELLAPYAFKRVMAWQPTHLSGVERPLYFASNGYWFVGSDFRAFDSWRFQSHAMDMSSHQSSRRYFFAGKVMLKQYSLLNPARRDFNLEEYRNEAEFLALASPEMDCPALLETVVDRDDCWIVREMLAGRLLLEMMNEHVPYAQERVVDGLIRKLVALEERGLYHNDVRCWNLLIDPASDLHLIDFGAISKVRADCVWPENLLISLLLTMREIFMGHVGPVLPVRRGLLDIGMLPMRYQAAFAHVLSMPKEAWSFKELQSRITGWAGEPIEVTGYVDILAAAERAMLSLEGKLAAEMHEGRLAQAELASSRAQLEGGRASAYAQLEAERASAIAQLEAERASAIAQLEAERASAAEQLEAERASAAEQLEAERASSHSALEAELANACAVLREELASSREDARRWYLLATERDEAIVALNDSQHSKTATHAALRRRIDGMAARLAVQEAEARQARTDHAAVVQSLQEWQARAAELDASVESWHGRAHELELQLREMRKSRSWKVTAPLRGFRRNLRHPFAFTRRALLALMRRVKRHPDLARQLNSVARLVPPLHAKLISVAVNNQIIAEVPATIEHEGVVGGVDVFAGLAERDGLDRLSLRGRAMYRDIVAIKRKEGN
ncbi:methyltransferase domain-containing protein [Stenotrophomonas rhizophila]|nr:methyltransferase domain-containing protein [Stenotrophomonas rhizophila]